VPGERTELMRFKRFQMSAENQGGQGTPSSGGQQSGSASPPAGIIGQAGVPATGLVHRSDNPLPRPNVNIVTKDVRGR
jgi:hypothetical protein